MKVLYGRRFAMTVLFLGALAVTYETLSGIQAYTLVQDMMANASVDQKNPIKQMLKQRRKALHLLWKSRSIGPNTL